MDGKQVAGGLALGLGLGAALARACGGSGGRPARTPFHPGFPPQALLEAGDTAAVGAWFDAHAPRFGPMEGESDRARQLCAWSAGEYVSARRAGTVACAEYAEALVQRMLYYRESNAFMLTSYKLTTVILEQAAALDARAAAEGVEAIAPCPRPPGAVKRP
jgi:hypothetical protein